MTGNWQDLKIIREVIISPHVYARIKDRIEVTSLGPVELKGISEPQELYRVERVLE